MKQVCKSFTLVEGKNCSRKVVVEKWFNISLTIWFMAVIKAFIISSYIQYYTHLNINEILRQVMLTYNLHGYLDNTHIHLLYNY